jgi:hypothetical protein
MNPCRLLLALTLAANASLAVLLTRAFAARSAFSPTHTVGVTSPVAMMSPPSPVGAGCMSVTLKWIAARLRMSSWSNVSDLLTAARVEECKK